MRMRRRVSVVVALATAVALGAVGVAQAINANSTVSFNFTKVPAGTIGTTLKQGKINVHTHTNYTGSGTKTDRARLFFDKNFAFNQSVVPKCSASQLSGNITMKAAMAACGTKLGGTGTARANASSPGDTQACVLAFNRNPNGILLFTRVFLTGQTANCSNPANNTGGFTTVLLQAPLATNPASTTPGGGLPAAFYQGGKWLDFNHITSVAALPLSDFNVTVGKGAPNTNLSGTKGNLIRAKCTLRSGSKKWVMRTIFKYTNGSPLEQVVNSQHSCN